MPPRIDSPRPRDKVIEPLPEDPDPLGSPHDPIEEFDEVPTPTLPKFRVELPPG